MEPVRVLVTAGDRLARAGLAALLEGADGIEVVGRLAFDAADADTWADAAAPFAARVVVVDLGGPAALGADAVAAAARLLAAGDDDGDGDPSRAAVIALVDDVPGAAAARSRGALGVVHRDASARRLAAAVRAVAAGLFVSTDDLAPSSAPEPPPLAGLTPREVEVLALVAEGLSNREIGAALGISVHTAKDHVDHAMAKLGATSRTGAAVRAARLGWLRL